MSPELQELLDMFTVLTEAEARFQKHSDKFLECREDILRHVHESCRIVSRKVHIRLADTGVCIFQFGEFILADTSAQR